METEKNPKLTMEDNETHNNSKNDNEFSAKNLAEVKEKLPESTTTDAVPAATLNVSTALTNVLKIKPIPSTMVTKILPTTTTLAKIAPKPNTSIVKQTSSNSKLVLIQSPGGTSQTIRIAGSTSTSSSADSGGSTGTNIRLIKMADGQLYQVKNKPLVSPTITTPSVTDKKPTPQHIGRVIVKGGVPQRIILSAPTSSVANTTPSSSPASRTYTVAQAQQLGLLSASKIKELVSAATTSSIAKKTLTPILPISSAVSNVQIHTTTVSPTTIAVNSTSTPISTLTVTTTSTPISSTNPIATSSPTTSSTRSFTLTPTSTTITPTTSTSLLTTDKLKQSPVSTQQQLISTQKIILKTTAGGIQKQMTLPQNIVKLAQGGQIRAVNVAGRGIQYVRVISSTTATNQQASANCIVTQAKSDTNKLIATASGASKLLVQSSSGGKQTYTLLSSSSNSDIDSKTTKIINTTVSTATQIKPTVTLKTQPTLVPITVKKSQNVVSKVAGPSLPINAKKEVAENEEKLKQFLQSQTIGLSGGTNSTVITPSSNPYLMSNIVRKQIEAENIKREKIASEITISAKQKLLTEKINANSLVSLELLPVKSDDDENSASSNDNIQIIEKSPTASVADDAVSGPRRKHCNCTKSQCLKLYCDCFANGEFCFNCTCKECFNNLEYESERFNAIKACLERNPHAFKPKIGKAKDTTDSTLRRHTKGCNCKRSGCLKNYCECYEAKICCSANCKCMGCRNVIETFNGQLDLIETTSQPIIKTEPEPEQSILNRKRSMDQQSEPPSLPITSSLSSAKHSTAKKPCNFMTQDVIEATVQCIISQADDCQQQNMDKTTSEKMILEEFGRCLVEIIEFSLKNNDN